MKYGIYIGAVIFIIIMHGKMGRVDWDKAWTIGLGTIAIWFMGGTFWTSLKEGTPKFSYDDGWFTIDPGQSMHEVGNWAVVTPAVRSWNMYWDFKSPVAIMPKSKIEHRGRNLVCNTKLNIRTFEELPDDIQDYIVKEGLRTPYLFGIVSIEEYMDELKQDDMIKKLQKETGLTDFRIGWLASSFIEQNKKISMLKAYLTEAYSVSEDRISTFMRMAERMQPSKWKEWIKSQFVEQPTV